MLKYSSQVIYFKPFTNFPVHGTPGTTQPLPLSRGEIQPPVITEAFGVKFDRIRRISGSLPPTGRPETVPRRLAELPLSPDSSERMGIENLCISPEAEDHAKSGNNSRIKSLNYFIISILGLNFRA
jgi:hypothetical protein